MSVQPDRDDLLQAKDAFGRAAVYALCPVVLLFVASYATASVAEGIPVAFIPCILASLLLRTGEAALPRFPRSAASICLVGLGFVGLTVVAMVQGVQLLLTVSADSGTQSDFIHRLLLAGGIALLPVLGLLPLRGAGRTCSVRKWAHLAGLSLWVIALWAVLYACPSNIPRPHSFAWAFGCWGISLGLLAGSVLACIRGIWKLRKR